IDEVRTERNDGAHRTACRALALGPFILLNRQTDITSLLAYVVDVHVVDARIGGGLGGVNFLCPFDKETVLVRYLTEDSSTALGCHEIVGGQTGAACGDALDDHLNVFPSQGCSWVAICREGYIAQRRTKPRVLLNDVADDSQQIRYEISPSQVN